MCFSASASFTAGVGLTLIGIVALLRAPRGYRLLASIPFLFALQQFSEGIVWLILTGVQSAESVARSPLGLLIAPMRVFTKGLKIPVHVDAILTAAVLTFLFFALVIWPFWLPLACLRCETNNFRSHIIFSLWFMGSIISCIMLFGLVDYGADAKIVGGHIVYITKSIMPRVSWMNVLLYTCATIGPLLVSSLPGASIIGGAILASELLAWHFWHAAFVSTWCFFAAILSLLIIGVLPDKKDAV